MEGTEIFPELVVRDQDSGVVLGTLRELIEQDRERNEAVIAGRTFHFGPYQGFTVETNDEGELNISITFKAPANAETQSAILALHTLALEGKLRAREARVRALSSERAGVQSE